MTKAEFFRQIQKAHTDFDTNFGELLKFKLHAPKAIDRLKDYNELAIKIINNGEEENSHLIDYLVKEIKDVSTFPPIIYSMTLVYAVSHFEVFLSRITKSLLTFFWKALKTKKQVMEIEEILSYQSIHELKESLIKQEIQKIAFNGIKDRIGFLEKKFGIDFSYTRVSGVRNNWNCIELEDLIEVHSTRNIIIHNNSIINDFYLRDNPRSKLEMGQVRPINEKYVLEAIFVLFRVSSSISTVAKNKVKGVKRRKTI